MIPNCGQRHRGDDRTRIRLEEVGSHAGHVAHVVAHVVRDGGGIARIVLRNARLDLADEIGADVGCLRENAATHARKERNRRRTEGESGQRLIVLKNHVEHGNEDEADADHRHPHHGAGREGHAQRGVQADARFGGGAHIRADSDVHADIAGRGRSDRAQRVGDRGARQLGPDARLDNAERGEFAGDVQVHEHGNQHRDDGHEDGQEGVLPPQEGRSPLLNQGGDRPHGVGPRVLAEDAPRRHDCEQQREPTRTQSEVQQRHEGSAPLCVLVRRPGRDIPPVRKMRIPSSTVRLGKKARSRA